MSTPVLFNAYVPFYHYILHMETQTGRSYIAGHGTYRSQNSMTHMHWLFAVSDLNELLVLRHRYFALPCPLSQTRLGRWPAGCAPCCSRNSSQLEGVARHLGGELWSQAMLTHAVERRSSACCPCWTQGIQMLMQAARLNDHKET